jgi:hypothetical protein
MSDVVAHNLLMYWKHILYIQIASFFKRAWHWCRFKLPSHLTYKNMEGLMNLEAEMDKTSDSEIASWVDNHFDRSLNWKVQTNVVISTSMN